MQYALKFSPEEDDIVVTSDDMPELLTSGVTDDQAMDMAEDALAVVLLTYLEKGIPFPAFRKPKAGERLVVVPAPAAAKISVIQAFRDAGITKIELARRLGVGETEARRILDPDHQTRLDKLDAAARVLGRRITVDLAA